MKEFEHVVMDLQDGLKKLRPFVGCVLNSNNYDYDLADAQYVHQKLVSMMNLIELSPKHHDITGMPNLGPFLDPRSPDRSFENLENAVKPHLKSILEHGHPTDKKLTAEEHMLIAAIYWHSTLSPMLELAAIRALPQVGS